MTKTGTQLGRLFDYHGTDKAKAGYDKVYEQLLGARREQVTAVLEVGVGTLNPDAPWSMHGHVPLRYSPGGSLRAWRDYFPSAVVWGLDVAPDAQVVDESRIVTCLCDSTDAAQVDQHLPAGAHFDLVVDDGDHSLGSQLLTLSNLWPRVRPGGFYVVEDRKQPMRWLSQFEDCIDTRMLLVERSMIVFKKP